MLIILYAQLDWDLSKTTHRRHKKRAQEIEATIDWGAVSPDDAAEIKRLKALCD